MRDADAQPTPPARTLRVAAVQSVSHVGDVQGNLSRAEQLVAEAAAQGAVLVACPEFLTPGYAWDRALRRYAEPTGGITETWLSTLARRHQIYVGAGYLESDGDDYFNTFTLVAPDGAVSGRVRKESLPAFEGWVFRSSPLPKTFDSPLGRIGVGICNDNHTARFFARMLEERPDVILMPHSAPCPPVGGKLLRDSVAEIGPFYARELGVPTLCVNKAKARVVSPVPGILPIRLPLEFPGMSTITDSNGEVRAQLPDREGVIVASVSLNPARKRRPELPNNGYWSRPPSDLPAVLGGVFTRLESMAKRAYERERRQRVEAE